MGVKRLWDLLEPCGHRISIEALSGRRYAVGTNVILMVCFIYMDPSYSQLHMHAKALHCCGQMHLDGCFSSSRP